MDVVSGCYLNKFDFRVNSLHFLQMLACLIFKKIGKLVNDKFFRALRKIKTITLYHTISHWFNGTLQSSDISIKTQKKKAKVLIYLTRE